MVGSFSLATFLLPPFLFFFFSFQFYPCESDQTRFSTIDLRIFILLPLRKNEFLRFQRPPCLPTHLVSTIVGRKRKRERVETSSIRWPAQDRYGRTSSPVAAVVNRYPGCLICIHPGTRASQRLERYSKGGRFLLVYLLVYLFVTPLSPFYSTTHASRFSPSSFLPLTFCAIFTTSVPPQLSYRGAARILSTFAGVIVSNRPKPAIRLATRLNRRLPPWWLLLPLALRTA